jgi:hypothetical protein
MADLVTSMCTSFAQRTAVHERCQRKRRVNAMASDRQTRLSASGVREQSGVSMVRSPMDAVSPALLSRR